MLSTIQNLHFQSQVGRPLGLRVVLRHSCISLSDNDKFSSQPQRGYARTSSSSLIKLDIEANQSGQLRLSYCQLAYLDQYRLWEE